MTLHRRGKIFQVQIILRGLLLDEPLERSDMNNHNRTPKAQKSGDFFHCFSNAQAKGQGQEIVVNIVRFGRAIPFYFIP